MELLDLSGAKWEVRLNGVLWNNCSVDAQCPGRALCARNVTWSAHPSMCFCSFYYDHAGGDCMAIGSMGTFHIVMHSFLSAVAIVLFLFGILGIFQLARIKRAKFDALTTSITEGLPREIELRQKQYEYYRNMLLSFPRGEE